jgi:hypothetical protein
MEESVTSTLLELKIHFYEWCEQLTLDEIIGNEKLRFVIERIERMLFAMGL